MPKQVNIEKKKEYTVADVMMAVSAVLIKNPHASHGDKIQQFNKGWTFKVLIKNF